MLKRPNFDFFIFIKCLMRSTHEQPISDTSNQLFLIVNVKKKKNEVNISYHIKNQSWFQNYVICFNLLISMSWRIIICCIFSGNFEESVLKGRLKPVSVVEGFSADLGASGTFCPQHLKLPVTVSYFSFEPHSAPYLVSFLISSTYKYLCKKKALWLIINQSNYF